MIEQEIDIATRDGAMNTFVTHPDEEIPAPVVLFLMDAPGKREELHDMARRIATVGYYVLLPNLYYRRVREFVSDGSQESRRIMFEHMDSLSNAMAVEDCRALMAYAERQPAARSGPVGVVGYCMSGPFAFAAAAQLSDRVRAAASMHGVRLYTDAADSPHREAEQIQGEMYFGCAETDDYAPQEMIDSLDTHLESLDVNYRIEVYPQTQHGFTFPQRAGKYDKLSAERHWARLFALFQRNLRDVAGGEPAVK